MQDLIEIEDSELDRIAEEKRHRQLMIALAKLIETIKKDTNSDNKISELVTTNNNAINQFLKKLSEISVPNINVEKSEPQEIDFSSFINAITEGQNKIIELLQMKPKSMKIIRTNNPYGDNIIKEIEIQYGDIFNIGKIKAQA